MADIQWFCDARFGMFIHWGLYAVPAKGEWYASIGRVPPERYEEYLRTFDPVDYDPRAWARLARQAGMKYAVLTAKHHEGFCLFDSAYTDYKATNTPAGATWCGNTSTPSAPRGFVWGCIIPWSTGTIPTIPLTTTPSTPCAGRRPPGGAL